MFPIPLMVGLIIIAVLLALWLTPKLFGWGKRAVESSVERFGDDLDGKSKTPRDETKLTQQLSDLIEKRSSLQTQVGARTELVAVEKEIAELQEHLQRIQ